MVSSMLKGLPQDKLMCPSDEHISTPILCLVLNCSTFPSAIYDRLLVECIHQWPLATTGRRREYELFRGFGQFDVDEDRQHRLMIRDTFDGVELKITRYSRIEPFPNSQICQKVLKFVSETLTKIGTQLGVALNIEQYIKCPVREMDTECRHAVEELMKPREILCHAHNEGPIIFTSTQLLMYWFESATHNELGAHKQVNSNRLSFTKEHGKSYATKIHLFNRTIKT